VCRENKPGNCRAERRSPSFPVGVLPLPLPLPGSKRRSWAMGVGKPASPPPFFRGGRRRLTKRRSVQVSLIRGKVLLEMCVGVGKRSAALSLEEEGCACGICAASCYRVRRARFRACDDFCPFRLTSEGKLLGAATAICQRCHAGMPPIGDGAATEQLRSSGFQMYIYTTENLPWSAWIYHMHRSHVRMPQTCRGLLYMSQSVFVTHTSIH
jgi:hypothetical protein